MWKVRTISGILFVWICFLTTQKDIFSQSWTNNEGWFTITKSVVKLLLLLYFFAHFLFSSFYLNLSYITKTDLLRFVKYLK